jgi:hypothetical protein
VITGITSRKKKSRIHSRCSRSSRALEEADAFGGELRQDLVVEQRVLLLDDGMPRRSPAIDFTRGLAVGGDRHRFSLSCSLIPASRISKNSSRLLLTMHRKRSRSSSGVRGFLGLPEHAPIEGEQAHLAILEVLRREAGGRLLGRGFGGRGYDVHRFVPSEEMDREGRFASETYYNHRFLAGRSAGIFSTAEAAARWLQSRGALAGSARMSRPAITAEKEKKTAMSYELIAGVDLGSNSFRVQIGRIVGDQIHPLDTLRETVRLGSGLTRENCSIMPRNSGRSRPCAASASACAVLRRKPCGR